MSGKVQSRDSQNTQEQFEQEGKAIKWLDPVETAIMLEGYVHTIWNNFFIIKDSY